MPLREPLARKGDDERGFVACERIDYQLRVVGAAQVSTSSQRGVRLQQLVFHRLRQDRLSVRAIPRTVVAFSPVARQVVASS
jgi:hypothetical protein